MRPLSINMDNKLFGFISAMCNSVKEGAAVLDKASGTIIFCNYSWLSIFDFDSVHECTITNWSKLRKIPLRAADLARRLRITDEKGVFTEQVEFLNKSCQSFWG